MFAVGLTKSTTRQLEKQATEIERLQKRCAELEFQLQVRFTDRAAAACCGGDVFFAHSLSFSSAPLQAAWQEAAELRKVRADAAAETERVVADAVAKAHRDAARATATRLEQAAAREEHDAAEVALRVRAAFWSRSTLIFDFLCCKQS